MGDFSPLDKLFPFALGLRDCFFQHGWSEIPILGKRHGCESMGMEGTPTESKIFDQFSQISRLLEHRSMSPLKIVVSNSHIGHFPVNLLEKEVLVFFQKAQVIHFVHILLDNLVKLHRK